MKIRALLRRHNQRSGALPDPRSAPSSFPARAPELVGLPLAFLLHDHELVRRAHFNIVTTVPIDWDAAAAAQRCLNALDYEISLRDEECGA
jgi:hypothetical protein